MNLTIIGCGKIVQKEHIPTFKRLGINVLGICDICSENIGSAAVLLDEKVKQYNCYKHMLDELNPDAILIALPHHLYEEAVKYCGRKGIKIIKEKPFAVSSKQAQTLAKLVNREKFELLTVCQKRYTESYQKLREIIQLSDSTFSHARIRYTIPSTSPNDGWRSSKAAAGGGVWLDMGYHIVDLIYFLFGEQKASVNYARLINSSKDIYDVDDISFVEMQIGNTYIFIYISCVEYEKNEDITLIGENTIIHANKEKIQIKNKHQELLQEINFEKKSPFIRMYEDFLNTSSPEIFVSNFSNSLRNTQTLEQVFKESGFKN